MRVDLGAVAQAIAVRVRQQRVCQVGIDFLAIGQPIAVGVGLMRVGGRRVFLEIGQTVSVGIGARVVGADTQPIGMLPRVGQTVAISIDTNTGFDGQLKHAEETVGIRPGVAPSLANDANAVYLGRGRIQGEGGGH